MSFRDILVQVDGSEASARHSKVAAKLAGRFGAHLIGSFLRSSFPSQLYVAGPYGGVPPTILPQLVEEHEQAMDRAAEASRKGFEAAASDEDVSSAWLTLNGDRKDEMVDAMRRTDLTVLGAEPAPLLADKGVEPATLGLASGGPVLVLPDRLADARLGRRVLVAWNGGREAARALRDAAPFLNEADKVFVLTVAPRGDRGPEGLLQRHLERHGCEAEVILDRSDDESAGRILRKQVEELGADLVVMGLYGRTRLQELLLGGVSRDMLRDPPVPLLVSH